MVSDAQQEAEVARQGKPKLVLYYTNQDTLQLSPTEWWHTDMGFDCRACIRIDPDDVIETYASFRADAMAPECRVTV